MAKLYFVTSEGAGILNPGGAGFRRLGRAEALAAKAAEECSWQCLTPPAPDNEVSLGKGNFRCGVLAAHGIHIRESVDGSWGEEHDVPDEKFQKSRGAGPHNDWALEVVIDRGTDFLAVVADTFFFTGPEQTDSGWDAVLDRIADGDPVVEAVVRPTSFGRYHHLIESGDYPMVWKDGGF